MENSFEGAKFLRSPVNEPDLQFFHDQRRKKVNGNRSSQQIVSRGSTRPSVGAMGHSQLDVTSNAGANKKLLAGEEKRVFQVRPITESRPKRGVTIETQLKYNEMLNSSQGYFSTNRQSQG